MAHEHPTVGKVETVRIIPDDWLRPLPLIEQFPNAQPLEVDLGCGKGRFLLSRAASHPTVNFLGIDRMLRRVRKVDRKAVRAQLTNVRLLRVDAYYATVYLIPAHSVRTYYVFFPDPWPKSRHHKNRLFNEPFMDALHRTLVDGGMVHVATDHEPYSEEIDALLDADKRFARVAPFIPSLEEQTDFERLFLGRTAVHRRSVSKGEGGRE